MKQYCVVLIPDQDFPFQDTKEEESGARERALTMRVWCKTV